MATYRDQGIVLRTWKLGETDRILNVLSQSRGKVRAVAKGVRRPGSRFGGRLEAFSHVDLQLYEGRNLDVITQAELIASHHHVREDYARSACAATMAELADLLAQEGERDNSLFLLLRAGLQALDARPEEPTVFLDAYLLRLAGVAGFPVSVDACTRCRRSGPHPFLSVSAGGTLCRDCAPRGTKAVSGDTLELVGLFAGHDWVPLARVAEQAPREARETAGSYARTYIEHHLDRRLKSYDLVPR